MSQFDYKPIPPLTRETIKRFWDNVDRRGPNDCWHWTGMLVNGYGAMSINGESYFAIRILHVIMNGADPGEMVVRHSCDVPSCCNFLHHTLGSHQQNMQDASERKRFASGDRNGSRTHPESRPRGEEQGGSKLMESDIIRIRERYAAGESCLAISKDYPVNNNNIQLIVKGKRWAHAGGPIVSGDLVRGGERSGRNALTEEQVNEILTKRSDGITIQSLCKMYNVSQGAITAIIYGHTWKHLGGLTDPPKKHLGPKQVVEIRQKYAGGQSMESLAEEYETSKSNIYNIVRRISWKEVK